MNLDQQAWRALWNKISLKDTTVADRWFSEINQRYNESHRSYHNAQHICDCLQEFAPIKRSAPCAEAIELALWLHDVIYDPHRSDNEDQSAQFAIKLLNEAQAGELITQRVASLIHSTRHDKPPNDNASELIIDIDLAILGQPAERFWQYETQIREEYNFVPEQTFRAKRAQILENFLTRPRIYLTPHFKNLYEISARENLSASVRKLRTD